MPENRKHGNTTGSSVTRELPWAVSSAILLLVPRVDTEFWYLSVFALVPYLWRLYRVNTRDSIILSVLLATLFIFATGASELWLDPGAFFVKLLALNTSLALFGITLTRVRKRLGFNPLLIALLWFPTEYMLIRYAGLGNIFSITWDSPGLIVGFCSLFGVLLGSLVVVLGNALLLLILSHVGRWICQCQRSLTNSQSRRPDVIDAVALEGRWRYSLDARGPPQQEM